jgi:hypothetical protein
MKPGDLLQFNNNVIPKIWQCKEPLLVIFVSDDKSYVDVLDVKGKKFTFSMIGLTKIK